MRVMMTRCVAEAWEIFCRQKRHVVIRSFRCLRIPLSIDGSCDEEISIKGLETLSLITALKKWRTQGAPACEDDESEETGSNSSGHEEELEMLSNSLATSDSLTRSSPPNPIPPQGERACTRRGRGGRARGAIHSTRGKKQQANLPSVSDGNCLAQQMILHIYGHMPLEEAVHELSVVGGDKGHVAQACLTALSPVLPTTLSLAVPTTPSPTLPTLPPQRSRQLPLQHSRQLPLQRS